MGVPLSVLMREMPRPERRKYHCRGKSRRRRVLKRIVEGVERDFLRESQNQSPGW